MTLFVTNDPWHFLFEFSLIWVGGGLGLGMLSLRWYRQPNCMQFMCFFQGMYHDETLHGGNVNSHPHIWPMHPLLGTPFGPCICLWHWLPCYCLFIQPLLQIWRIPFPQVAQDLQAQTATTNHWWHGQRGLGILWANMAPRGNGILWSSLGFTTSWSVTYHALMRHWQRR